MFSRFLSTPSEQSLLVPEVVQTSAMDCGPATLKCLVEGFGIPVSYSRLREACQTDVDGTSIDTLESVAQQLGLVAEQMVVPVDHLFLSSAELLPALVVTVQPSSLLHFVVVWRQHGPFIQVMDPASGRRWSTHKRFLNEIYRYRAPFPATAWRAWAGTSGLLDPLQQRLDNLELTSIQTTNLIDAALADASWRGLAILDAATRMVNSIVQSGGIQRGAEARRVIERFFEQSQHQNTDPPNIIPEPFWSVHLFSSTPNGSTPVQELLMLQGAVILHIEGLCKSVVATPVEPEYTSPDDKTGGEKEKASSLKLESSVSTSPDLKVALDQTDHLPEQAILEALRADGLLTPIILSLAALLAAASITMEAALFRGLMVLSSDIGLVREHMELLVGLCIFMVLLLLIELPIATIVLRISRRLETRLRIIFLQKIPRLGDRYFHSRLISDMAQRAYSLHQMHTLPDLALRSLRLFCQLILTAGGVIWLYPGSAPMVLLAMICIIGGMLLVQPILTERDMRVRTYNGALSRFYLDALMGLAPIRTHSAERAMRREHEMLTVAWVRESLTLARIQTMAQTIVALMGIGFSIGILLSYITSRGEASSMLLLLYWTLNLPALGQSLATTIRQYPTLRNNVRRVLEPLSAPEEDGKVTRGHGETVTDSWKYKASDVPATFSPLHPFSMSQQKGVALQFRDVKVQASGQVILNDINLTIEPGEHVAIVGASGAGKSSLVGVLLGWHHLAMGRVLVNGTPLSGENLPLLRRMMAWVDPSIQLWNRSLQENLYYGATVSRDTPVGSALREADLHAVLEKLPDGIQTRLGEGGGLVSGGEGQRVRLGRALLRPDVRLVILDEPFRGLDRIQRHQLLKNARHQWQEATLLCITHDVGETQDFARILVLEEGHIVEDGTPQELAAQSTSRYRALLDAEKTVSQKLGNGANWRRLRLENGQLCELFNPEIDDKASDKTRESDPLQQIKGIGPVFAKRLHQAGVHTLAELARLTPAQVKEMISTNKKPTPANVQAWLDQARQQVRITSNS